MRIAIAFLALLCSALSQVPNSAKNATDGLLVELRTDSDRVRMSDEIVVTVFFRSPAKEITLWNAFGWGATAGLSLRVFDSSGHKVHNNFLAPFFHPLPPDLSGKDELISISGSVFAGSTREFWRMSCFPSPASTP
jgi:hypothetical protein